MCVKAPTWEILILWSMAKGKHEDGTCQDPYPENIPEDS